MMKADEILEYLNKDVIPIYNGLSNAEMKICHAVLQSLPYNVQEEVSARLGEESDTPKDLISFVNWMLEEHPREPYVPNEPISTLLRLYTDKNSKKVTYAYERLVDRYQRQSYAQQKKILKAFLSGGKKSSEWAGRQLHEHWVRALGSDVESAWRKYHGAALAKTIVRHMKEDFVYQERNALLEDIGDYSVLCARLGHRADFTIDESRLTIPGWFYVAGKLALSEWIPKMDAMVDEYIRSLNCKEFIYVQSEPELIYLRDMGRIIWGMKRLCYTGGIIRLAKFQRMAKKMIDISDIKQYRFASFVYFLKSFVSDDIYDDDAYKKEVQSWYIEEYGYVPINA